MINHDLSYEKFSRLEDNVKQEYIEGIYFPKLSHVLEAWKIALANFSDEEIFRLVYGKFRMEVHYRYFEEKISWIKDNNPTFHEIFSQLDFTRRFLFVRELVRMEIF